MTSSLKLEVGKRYRTRGGQIIGPLGRDDHSTFPFHDNDPSSSLSWTRLGTEWSDRASVNDLVEEVREPVYDFAHETDPAYAPTPHLVSAARRPGGGVVLFTDGKIAFEVTTEHATHLIARIAQAIVACRCQRPFRPF